jgi:hypothetical protein
MEEAKMRLKKSSAVMPALILALSMAGVQMKCEDSDLQKIETGLTTVRHALEGGVQFAKVAATSKKEQVQTAYAKKQTDINKAVAVGTMTAEDAAKVLADAKTAGNKVYDDYANDCIVALDIMGRLAEAGKIINAKVGVLAQLDPQSRTDIHYLAEPLLSGFTEAIDKDILKITNPDVRAQIKGYLVTAKEALEFILKLTSTGGANASAA